MIQHLLPMHCRPVNMVVMMRKTNHSVITIRWKQEKNKTTTTKKPNQQNKQKTEKQKNQRSSYSVAQVSLEFQYCLSYGVLRFPELPAQL